MLFAHRLCRRTSLLVLCVAGCDRRQPFEPLEASSAGFVAAAPSNAKVVAVSETRIDVSWQDNSSNEAGFEVYVSMTGLSTFNLWTTTGPNVTTQSITGVNPRQESCVEVRAFTMRGQSGKVRAYSEFSDTACASTPPPAGPSSIAARPLSSSSVEITWSSIAVPALGARVERSIDQQATWTTVIETSQFTLGASDYGRSPESPELCYRVIVKTQFGESTPSNVDCTTPPAAPGNLVAPPLAGAAVDLAWADNSGVEDGYEVERISNGTSTVAAVLGSGATSYHDGGLTPNATYYYRVRATKDGGFSDYSNTVVAVVADAPPDAPSGTQAVPNGSSAVAVGWVDNAGTEEGFRVERSTDGGATWESAGTTGVNESSLYDEGRTPEQEVCYRVFAVNRAGASAPSERDCTTPPAAPTNLVVVGIDDQTAEVSWTDNSGVEEGYELWLYTYDYCYYYYECPYYYAVALPANTTSYRFAISDYVYGVVALKDGGYSDWLLAWVEGTASTVTPAALRRRPAPGARPKLKEGP